MTFLPWLPPALAATSTARLEQANKSVTACGDWGEADVSKTPASIEELQAHHCSTTTNTLPSMTFLYLICSHPTSTPATSPSATSLLLVVVHPSIHRLLVSGLPVVPLCTTVTASSQISEHCAFGCCFSC
jgi:hypothetical protein